MQLKKVVSLLFFLLLLASPTFVYAFDWGNQTNYQGLQVEFAAVRWNGYLYTEENTGPNPNYEIVLARGGGFQIKKNLNASACQFNDRLNFDPDMANDGLPNIMGATSPIVPDSSATPKTWTWRIPQDTPSVQLITNTTGTYKVTSTTYKEFNMTRTPCLWPVNLWMAADHLEAFPADYTHFNNAEIIFHVEMNNPHYFEGNSDTYYETLAYVALNEAPIWSYYDEYGEEVKSSVIAGYQAIFPGARGETLGLYNNEDLSSSTTTEEKLLSYRGFNLDTSVFKDQYLRIGLDVWMPVTVWGTFHTDWFEKLPSVQLVFQVHKFSVGTKTVVLEESEVVPLEVHKPQERDKPQVIDLPDVNLADIMPLELKWALRFGALAVAILIIMMVLNKIYGESKNVRKNLKKVKETIQTRLPEK